MLFSQGQVRIYNLMVQQGFCCDRFGFWMLQEFRGGMFFLVWNQEEVGEQCQERRFQRGGFLVYDIDFEGFRVLSEVGQLGFFGRSQLVGVGGRDFKVKVLILGLVRIIQRVLEYFLGGLYIQSGLRVIEFWLQSCIFCVLFGLLFCWLFGVQGGFFILQRRKQILWRFSDLVNIVDVIRVQFVSLVLFFCWFEGLVMCDLFIVRDLVGLLLSVWFSGFSEFFIFQGVIEF